MIHEQGETVVDQLNKISIQLEELTEFLKKSEERNHKLMDILLRILRNKS